MACILRYNSPLNDKWKAAGHMKPGRFTIAIVLLLLVSRMTAMAAVPATLPGAIFGIENTGRTEPPGNGWEGEKPDRESAKCLSCHDGLTASDIPIGQQSTRTVQTGSSGGSHPIGISYSRAYSGNHDEYVAEASLDPTICLVDGMLSCVTCHERRPVTDKDTIAVVGNVHISNSCTASKKLVIDNTGSRLCFGCHLK